MIGRLKKEKDDVRLVEGLAPSLPGKMATWGGSREGTRAFDTGPVDDADDGSSQNLPLQVDMSHFIPQTPRLLQRSVLLICMHWLQDDES